ncbi:elongation factor P [candidate division WOR-3 bacterium]|nr:elongation factor P [candidate division WOR-3 bacterium]
MAKTQDVKRGTTLKFGNDFFTVIDFAHIKIGRGGAFVRLKLKNSRTGAVLEKTLTAGESVEIVRVEEHSMQYIYKEGELYYFMNPESYEQMSLSAELLKDAQKYLKENKLVKFISIEEEIIEVKLPNFCELQVVETEPPIKDARASGGLKPAKLETGASVKVPLFITVGEIVKVDTRTGNYIERVK